MLIGLEDNGKIVAGHEYFPATGEMFSAAKGEGAWWDGKRIHASDVTKKAQALLCCNGVGFMHRYPFKADFLDWISEFWTVRSCGGCLDAMLVASGRADVWIAAQAAPGDLAPLKNHRRRSRLRNLFDFTGKDTIYGGNFTVITVPALADEVLGFVSRKA